MKKIGPFKNRRFKPSKKGDRDRCECSIGIEYNRGPHVLMCKEPAAWIYFGTKEPTCRLGMLACEKHYEQLTKGES